MDNSNKEERTIAVYAEDTPGVLAAIAVLVRDEGHNISNLAVGPCEEKGRARFTILVEEEGEGTSCLAQTIGELQGVISSEDITEKDKILEELALIKLRAEGAKERDQIITLVGTLTGAKIIRVGHTTLIVRMAGKPEEIEDLLVLLEPNKIEMVVRTAPITMPFDKVHQERPPMSV